MRECPAQKRHSADQKIFSLSVETAEQSLKVLIDSGFIVKKGQRWQACDPVIDSGDEVFAHSSMIKIHAETLRIWSSRLDECDPQHLELGLLNIPISRARLPEFKKRIREFQDEMIGWLQSEENPELVVQLGTYLVPFEERK